MSIAEAVAGATRYLTDHPEEARYRDSVAVDSESDDRGILGMADDVPAGALSTRIAVAITAAGRPANDVEALVQWAVDHCPSSEALRRAVPLEVVIES